MHKDQMDVIAKTQSEGLEWSTVLFMTFIHIPALILPVLFVPKGNLVVICFFLLGIPIGLGVTIGYHRRLTHASFQAPKVVDYFLALMGALSGEGPPVFWVAHHRKHHKYSDEEGDPHSPRQGFWWAHWFWIFSKLNKRHLGMLYMRWAPDIVKDPFYQWLERNYLFLHIVFVLCIFGMGYAMGSWYMAMSFLAYVYFLRAIVTLHITWMVNSVTHKWGYRNYETQDGSRNNALVGVLAYGEGWHNNHHHRQRAVNHGHFWWEFDLSFWVIVVVAIVSYPLKYIGLSHWRLASQLKYYSHRSGKIITLFV